MAPSKKNQAKLSHHLVIIKTRIVNKNNNMLKYSSLSKNNTKTPAWKLKKERNKSKLPVKENERRPQILASIFVNDECFPAFCGVRLLWNSCLKIQMYHIPAHHFHLSSRNIQLQRQYASRWQGFQFTRLQQYLARCTYFRG